MRLRYTLVSLPIHRRSFHDYYEAHDRQAESRRAKIEEEWGQPFDQLPPHVRLFWKDQWYWPPWFFNDVAGYLHLGSDGAARLGADLYLRREHFPPTDPASFSRHGHPEEHRDIVYFASLEPRRVDPEDNATYLVGLAELIAEGHETVRRMADDLGEAEVWAPGYDLSCVDWSRADRQLRERFPERIEDPAAKR